MLGFWQKLSRPIIALSPMDGVTDAPFRLITARHGIPDVHFTEFTNVEGLSRNAIMMLDDFLYSEFERPVVAQIYGSEPESFYKIAIVVCELGFDGIDINMGCPAKKVAARGCGAGLIRNPPLAKEIMRQVKRGIHDWTEGRSITDLGFKAKMIHRIREMNLLRSGREDHPERRAIPMSVKTRIGYDSITIKDWVQHLLEEEPVVISIHGRTLKQMYTGSANWEAIAEAAEIIKKTPSLVLGNGDLNSAQDIIDKVRLTQVDGVLIGRGCMGNPWIFRHKEKIKSALSSRLLDQKVPLFEEEPISFEDRFKVLIEHARVFEEIKGHQRFTAMRKHFAWYCKGMPKASELRNRMCQTHNSQEVENLIAEYSQEYLLDFF
ncbi:MAG: tRNA-dihydrouridine synthase [Deltaproteobacteria bacterium]|nr:tRNA-dihydrouridine synthase [Deltaproteobacteria bacterium]